MPNRPLVPNRVAWLAIAAGLAVAGAPRPADACGCLSPPAVVEGEFAVNQQAEQIIFEVGESTVTAHVLIRYQGDPAQFAWIVPVPNQPQLAVTEPAVFALLDELTAQNVSVLDRSACPEPAYVCRYHFDPCDDGDDGGTGGAFVRPPDADGGGEPPGGVDVLDMQVVGDYETVTFAASDAALAVQWLQDNGFVVNDTMTPYMQPYIDAGMVFVAAKLVAGAGLDAIKPLSMTYQGTTPMIPLKLTAVAAEPHLTVTAYIYGQTYFVPDGHPVVLLQDEDISRDAAGRTNYPMVMARTLDEAGGDAFVTEFAGAAPSAIPSSNCCTSGDDFCALGNDGLCQCPTAAFDEADCTAIPGLLEAVDTIETLRMKHSHLTRLTTRLSPEEMTFDPSFVPQADAPPRKPFLGGSYYDLSACMADVIATDTAAWVDAIDGCAAVYCGKGQCVATDAGVGCACDAGHVARVFTDLDGDRSVTCVPETPPVILDKEVDLPDPCAGVDCGPGAVCHDLGGFAACACGGSTGAVVRDDEPQSLVPLCRPILTSSSSPGAENFSVVRKNIPVCFPPPPEDCGPLGWLEPLAPPYLSPNGVFCNDSMPADPSIFTPPERPGPDSCWPGDEGGTSQGTGTGTGTGTDGGSGAAAGGSGASCGCRTGPVGAAPLCVFAVTMLARRRRPRRA